MEGLACRRIKAILNVLYEEKGECSMEYLRSLSNDAIKTELSRYHAMSNAAMTATRKMTCMSTHKLEHSDSKASGLRLSAACSCSTCRQATNTVMLHGALWEGFNCPITHRESYTTLSTRAAGLTSFQVHNRASNPTLPGLSELMVNHPRRLTERLICSALTWRLTPTSSAWLSVQVGSQTMPA